MSLDQNLFTLLFTPSKEDPNVVDLVEPSGTIHYRKQRVAGPTYAAEVYDFMSESLLVTVSAPSATSKVKTLELCNPSTTVELKYTGTLSFRWSFKWEEHEFEWKREECFLIRKPDPPVLVAVTREPPGKLKSTSVQLLDYNLNRFDVNDRKGLEIVILTALLTFQDSNETYHAGNDTRRKASGGTIAPTPRNTTPPPIPPPKPAPKTGVDLLAEEHAIRGDVNEVTVNEESTIQDYAQYCFNLLQDDAMLFITIKSHSAEDVAKVIQVAEETKRIRHRAGLAEESELHQYVVHDTVHASPPKKGPRRIRLDDDDKSKDKYTPPKSLMIHLSKIPMPELQPKPTSKSPKDASFPPPPPVVPLSGPSKLSKEEKKAARQSAKLQRRSPSPPRLKVPAHKVHPHQPSPSPSQLNNPGIYVAPPPPRNNRMSYYGPTPPYSGPSSTTPVVPPRPSSTEPSLYGSASVPAMHPSSSQHQRTGSSLVSGFFDALQRRR